MWDNKFGKVISTKPLKIDTVLFPKWLIKDNNSILNENGKCYLVVHRGK